MSNRVKLMSVDLAKKINYTSGWKYLLSDVEGCEHGFAIAVPISIPDAITHESGLFGMTPIFGMPGYSKLWLDPRYAWNGANCYPDTDAMMRASAVHDALLQLLGLKMLAGASVYHGRATMNAAGGTTGLSSAGPVAIKLQIDKILRELYYHDLKIVADRASWRTWKFWRPVRAKWAGGPNRRRLADIVFASVQKFGNPSGMKPVKVLSAP